MIHSMDMAPPGYDISQKSQIDALEQRGKEAYLIVKEAILAWNEAHPHSGLAPFVPVNQALIAYNVALLTVWAKAEHYRKLLESTQDELWAYKIKEHMEEE